MIKSFVFFPFTHITQSQLDTLRAFFESFHYLTAGTRDNIEPILKPLVDEKKVIPHFIPENKAIRVEQNYAQYMDWVKIHRGNEHNLKALLKDNPYFKDDTDVASIKSRLRRGNEIEVDDHDLEKNLDRHLLFLKMAHVFDSQHESIDSDLGQLDKTKEHLLATLRGIETDAEKTVLSGTDARADQGAIMTRERLESWAAAMSQLNGYSTKEPPVFVTTSQAVFDYLESICEDCLNALDIDEIKVHENDCENKKEWQHYLYKNIESAVQGDGVLENGLLKVADACTIKGQIKLGLFSGNEINKSFNLSDKQIAVCLIKLK